MKSKLLLFAAVGLSAVVAACGSDHSAAPPPTPPPTTPPPTSMNLDTAQVLTLAQSTSETGSPLPVNGGALTLNDTSETTAPIAVTAM